MTPSFQFCATGLSTVTVIDKEQQKKTNFEHNV